MATYESKKYSIPGGSIRNIAATAVADGSVTDAEYQFINTLGSNAQTQLDAKLPLAGGSLSGNISLADDIQARFGAGNDLRISHSNSAGADRIESDNTLQLRTDTFRLENAAGTENMIAGNADGAVTLYHNDSAKLATESGGVTVTGTLSATTISGALSGNISQFTNNSGYVTSSGVTSVATGNGLSGGTITSTGTLTMSGSFSGGFSATGNLTAFSSDERLKNFKGKIENALDKVDQLNGYYYEWNDVAKNLDGGKSFKDGIEVGVSAQEIEKVLPEVVTEAPIVKIENLDVDYKTVYYDKIVPLLIEAIKELRAEVKKLKEDK